MPEKLVTVPLPHMGVSVDEATVVGWHKAVGDAVRADEALCDISTDKVDTEIVSPADGVLARIVAEIGDTVAVGATLAELAVGVAVAETPVGATLAETPVGATLAETPVGATHAETPVGATLAETPVGVTHAETPVGATLAETPVGATHAERAPAVAAPGQFDPAAAAQSVLDRAGNGGRGPISSPVARRLAREHGVELAALAGSGLRGRIRKADVLAALEPVGSMRAPEPEHALAAAPPGARDERSLPRGYDDVPHEVVTTSRQRRLIAEHMTRSRQTAAHMTTEAEVDMTRAAGAREQLNAARAATGLPRLSYLALIAKATCSALQEFPDLNATFQTERLIRWGEVNLGIAVDTEQGLIAPVIRGCERLTAPAIADAIGDLAARARSRKLTPDDMRGGTFTISNPGSVGAYSAMAIINQPQVAILGTPVIVRRPTVVVDDQGLETIGIRPIMALALTFDHRAVDGAYATRCLVRIKSLLESWDVAAYA